MPLLISFIITTVTIHHSFALPLQGKNLSFAQIFVNQTAHTPSVDRSDFTEPEMEGIYPLVNEERGNQCNNSYFFSFFILNSITNISDHVFWTTFILRFRITSGIVILTTEKRIDDSDIEVITDDTAICGGNRSTEVNACYQYCQSRCWLFVQRLCATFACGQL